MRLANNWVTCVPSLVFGVGGCSVDSKQPIRSPLVRGERKESYNWGGESPTAGEEKVLSLGRKEACYWGGESPITGEERVQPLGRRKEALPHWE